MRSFSTHNRAIVKHLVYPTRETCDPRNLTHEAKSRGVSRTIGRYVTAREAAVIGSAVCLIAGFVAAMAPAFCVLLTAVAGVAAVASLARRRELRRSSAIERDLPALLTAVASSVRAGIDPLRALGDAESFLPVHSPIAREVHVFKRRLAAGDDEVRVVERFFEGEDIRDVELFKQCVLLSRRHGSSLAEPLHRVVRVVRQRQSFQRKTRAALAMHQMSACGIMLCAILISCMQVAVNMTGVTVALSDTRGVMLVSVGGSLVVIGVLWMTRMGREERL